MFFQVLLRSNARLSKPTCLIFGRQMQNREIHVSYHQNRCRPQLQVNTATARIATHYMSDGDAVDADVDMVLLLLGWHVPVLKINSVLGKNQDARSPGYRRYTLSKKLTVLCFAPLGACACVLLQITDIPSTPPAECS